MSAASHDFASWASRMATRNAFHLAKRLNDGRAWLGLQSSGNYCAISTFSDGPGCGNPWDIEPCRSTFRPPWSSRQRWRRHRAASCWGHTGRRGHPQRGHRHERQFSIMRIDVSSILSPRAARHYSRSTASSASMATLTPGKRQRPPDCDGSRGLTT